MTNTTHASHHQRVTRFSIRGSLAITFKATVLALAVFGLSGVVSPF